MKPKFFVALAALPLAAAFPQAAQADVYAACFYQDSNDGTYPFTQLFTLDDYALKDSYGEYSRDKTAAWLEQFAGQNHGVREISGFYSDSFVGQFVKWAETEKKERGNCWMTTEKDNAFRWYRAMLGKGKWNKMPIRDWRPSKGTVISVEDWPPN